MGHLERLQHKMLDFTLRRAIRLLHTMDDEDSEDQHIYEYKFAVVPRRCAQSNRWVWGRAIRVTTVWEEDVVVKRKWLHPDLAVMQLLKGTNHGNI